MGGYGRFLEKTLKLKWLVIDSDHCAGGGFISACSFYWHRIYAENRNQRIQY